MTALAVLDVWQDLALGGGVAPQLVRDDHPQDVAQTAQQFVEEALGGFGITPALHEDVEHLAVLVYRTPQIVLLAADADEHLVHEPFVARPWPAPPQRVGEHPSKCRPQSRMLS
jgi:hypothetical protein